MRRTTRAIACSVLVAAAVLAVFPLTAGARVTAIARWSSQSVGSGGWGMVAVPQGAAATTGPLEIDWSKIKGTSHTFVDLVSVKTLATTGQTFTIQTVATSGGNIRTPTLTLDACVGAAWTATNTCSGTVVTLGSATNGSFSSTVAIQPGARLSVRVSSSGSPGGKFVSTIDVSVSRSQVRAAATSNG